MKLFGFKISSFALLTMMFMASACTSYKQVPYMQNSNELATIEQANSVYEAKIQPNDLLSIIVVSSKEPISSAIYNLTVSLPFFENGVLNSQPTYQDYLVDTDGNITFPTLGKLHVAGLTRTELENLILEKIKGAFVEAPIVTVRFVDFRISVLGEVQAPGTYAVHNENINIFQALALAKDMTIYGMRENVKVIREDSNGKTIVHELNLNDANIVNSPFYHLQQNDVVYVTPNKAKAKGSDVGSTTSLWFSATSILISLTSLLYNILN